MVFDKDSVSVMEEKSCIEIKERVQAYADSQGFVLNPDIEKLNLVLKGLHRNVTKHGAEYCPCRIKTGDPEKDKDIICPCAFHKDEIAKQGFCHCHLFYKT
ncbi:MAG: ferredoxin:thioredoxin reductase [Methanomicrobiales archaeon]|jgi:ferredoxin-thioredoxin reductase catalytic subunit|nr:ferredoxin:thioredoxin reductase [Methanomicrobiales archaeon]